MDATFIVTFGLASLVGIAVLGLIIVKGSQAKQAQAKLARNNGWEFEIAPASDGRGNETVISDPKEGWRLTLYAHSGTSGNSGNSTRWSMFEDPRSSIPQGMAVLGPEIPEKAAAMADKMLGMLGGDLGLMLLNKMTGGLGAEAQGIRSIDSVGPGHLMASPGAETALDDLRFAPELTNARVGRKDADQPLVMRGPFGLRVRVSRLLRKPDDIKDFIELGRALSDNLKP